MSNEVDSATPPPLLPSPTFTSNGRSSHEPVATSPTSSPSTPPANSESSNAVVTNSTDSEDEVVTTVPTLLAWKAQSLPPLVIKPSMIMRSPYAFRDKPSPALFQESEKLRRIHFLRSMAVKRAIAEQRLSKQVFKETKLLDVAESNGEQWDLRAPSLAFAVASSAKASLEAERAALRLQIEEAIENLQLMRDHEEDMEQLIEEADDQLQYLKGLYQDHGIAEEDLDVIKIEDPAECMPTTPLTSPPPSSSPLQEDSHSTQTSGTGSPSLSRPKSLREVRELAPAKESASEDETASEYKSASSQV
ncbi:hypothetical protein CVT26_011469 [Gymnopilus dilepis]|uniref:Uncharacterized protein n=1 Tax=Gymnopilus dilepis TaxID=231916 RepID=A0A409W8P2_9AGAR|nr:hypothetical protein CVT26_011469 [Gymnopilus dilepis]